MKKNKRMKLCALTLSAALCVPLLSACGTTADDEMAAELAAYKEKYGELSGSAELADASNDSSSNAIQASSSAADLTSQMEYREYVYENSIGGIRYVPIVTNNSDFTVSIGVNVTAYSADGNMVGSGTNDTVAVESGFSVPLPCSMSDLSIDDVDHFEYTLMVSEDTSWLPVMSNIDFQVSKSETKIIVSATNTGEKPADFVECHALFFKNGELVDVEDTYMIDNEDQLKPGVALTVEISPYVEFDDVQVYFTGRAEK